MLNAIISLASLPIQVARRQKEQWLSHSELAALRQQRIRELLETARAATYYNRTLSGFTFPNEPLERMPLLDKKIIADNGIEALFTAGSGGLMATTTSGSTGHPMRFFRSTREEADFSARWYRIYSSYGGRPRDTIINITRPGVKPRSGAAKVMRDLGILPKIRNVSVTAPTEESVRVVSELKASFITGYAIGIENIADHIVQHGIQVQSPKAVLCGAMDVSDRCRALVNQAFGAPAVNVYASVEFGVIAWECPERRGSLHVNDDILVVEILDEDGRPVPDGVPGEVVITSLTLKRMPLLRYRTGDTAARIAERCTCGRGLGLMTPVQGRTSHTIVGPEGRLITAPVVAAVMAAANAYQWVRRFQLREQHNHVLTLLVEPICEPTGPQKENLVAQLAIAVGSTYKLRLEMHNALPLAPTGKYQYVVPLAPVDFGVRQTTN